MRNTTEKTYTSLSNIDSYEDRFNYLKLDGSVGVDTFGYDRYLNQVFYASKEWKSFRNKIISRDDGCDMGHPEHPIRGMILIHHLNPITKDDVLNRADCLFDPDNVVCVSKETHNAIHYGDDSIIRTNALVERTANDTCPWLKGVSK